MALNIEPAEVAFVGSSGNGKTTLVEALLPSLAARGLRVGVVKHTHHLVDWDTPGKDSWRFREAGAARVVLVTPEMALSESRPADAGVVRGMLEGLDLVIHEGQRWSETTKVLVRESVGEARARGTNGNVLAVIDAEAEEGVRRFNRDDIEGVARLLCQFVRRARGSGPAGFDSLLERAVAAHGHLCPGQVLGVRIAMRGLGELGLPIPPPPRRLIAVVETDRCAADAVASVSGCSLGRRTLKHHDFGKMAASFLDLETGKAVRVSVREGCRERAALMAPGAEDAHGAQTQAYGRMPDDALLSVQAVEMSIAEADLPGRPRTRVRCVACGEEVSDGREVQGEGGPLCRGCAGPTYYRLR